MEKRLLSPLTLHVLGSKQCFAVFYPQEHLASTRRRLNRTGCFDAPTVVHHPPSGSFIYALVIFSFSATDESEPLLTRGAATTTINYKTVLKIPYERVLRDDQIPIEPSDLWESDGTDNYLLFRETIHNPAYEPGRCLNAEHYMTE